MIPSLRQLRGKEQTQTRTCRLVPEGTTQATESVWAKAMVFMSVAVHGGPTTLNGRSKPSLWAGSDRMRMTTREPFASHAERAWRRRSAAWRITPDQLPACKPACTSTTS
eukprot:360436-Chlamydomonas_euryale.AAC.2